MSDKLKIQITDFINGKLKDSGKTIPEDFGSSTPLITSGLLESLYLLELAVFIEETTGTSFDLTSLDFTTEWNTIEAIVKFVNNHNS